MLFARRIYEHPRARAAAIFLGILLIIGGDVLDGSWASALRTFGIVLALAGVQVAASMAVCRNGYSAAHRDGYQRGRRVSKPVVVVMRRDEPAAHH